MAADESRSGSEWALLAVLIILAGLAMNVSLAVNLCELTGRPRWLIHGALASAGLIAVALTWRELLHPAWLALRERRLVTEHLFLAGIAAAWVVSVYATLAGRGAVFYEVPVLLPAIRHFGTILLGRQARDIHAASREWLAGLTTARVRRGDGWQLVSLPAVGATDRLWVKPGETIPVDGTIAAGQAFVQTRTLTGEPYPLAKGPGDPVLAGMIALDGDLLMDLSRLPAASEISRIAAATQRLLEKPPAFLGSVDTVMRWFLPGVLTVSLLATGGWAWRVGWAVGIHHGLAVVLIACPCAFGLALPLLFRRGLSACLQRGIQPVHPGFMETLSQVRLIAFDKTGTLTTPAITVAELHCAPGVRAETVRALLAVLHAHSDHPVARPFWAWAGEGTNIPLRHLQPLPGLGLRANVRLAGSWHDVRVGSERLLESGLPAWAQQTRPQRRIVVILDGTLIGICLLGEQLRSHASAACTELAAQGWRTAVVTGDSSVPPDLRQAVNEVHLAQSPQAKAARVLEWQAARQPVLYLGDGPNDALALAAATASVAVDPGSSLVSAAAQAYWRHPELSALPELMAQTRALAARARGIVRVAILYNLLGMAVAAAGLLHPVVAAMLMLVSSATVMALAARASQPAGRVAALAPMGAGA